MTVTRKSALWPTIQAMVDAVAGASSLASLLSGDKVYNTTAPSDATLDYITLSNPAENDDTVFGAPGTSGVIQIDIWSDNDGKLGNGKALRIYDALYGLLHKQPLSVTGFRHVLGTLALVTVLPDEDGLTTHGIANYTIVQRQA
jgi:hypothetical protein